MNKQQIIFGIMILAILILLSVGVGAIALLNRSGNRGIKVSIKATVIAILLVFFVVAINVIMLGLNEG